ncbi:MAG: hypothetical protein ACLBM1_10995, partial [Cuspidothrix sp.]
MKNQGFHISNLSLQSTFTALLLIAGSSTLIPTQVKAGNSPVVTAQAPASANAIYVNSATGQDVTGTGTVASPYKTITFA